VRYGHFDDPNREYVIERPDTPRSWSNYLGTTRYGAVITNNAGGYSFFHSAAQGRMTRLVFNNVPMDQPGRYFYLRDAESGDFWSASWQPVGKDLTRYRSECRHGTAYTTITSQYEEIESESTYFVPLDRDHEIWILKLANRGARTRRLSLFTYLEFANEWAPYHDQFNMQYSQYIQRCEFRAGMIAQSLLGSLPEDPAHFENRDQARHTFLALVGADVTGWDTDREAFLGAYRSYDRPLVVEQGRCTGSLAYGDNACGVLSAELQLAPGEERELLVVFGVGRAETAGQQAVAEFKQPGAARRALADLKQHWHRQLGAVHCKTPDVDLDSMVNVWNAYNCLITFAWSRAASLVYSGERDGLGFRDTVQDIMGVLPLIPESARERLELMITGQAHNGGAMPIVKPFAHSPGKEPTPGDEHYRSDDCLWLFETIPAYVKETGDLAFFDKVLPYADRGEDTVLKHLRRAISFNLERRGAHELPCGLSADWNDTLVLGYRGESVFVAFQLRRAMVTYIEICKLLSRDEEIGWAKDRLRELDSAIRKHCWDGEWFVRAFREDGSVIGSRKDAEGSIFLNSQTWAVMSGAATSAQARLAMDAVHERLATEFGILLCEPPFLTTDVKVLRAVLYNPGTKENAGIFTHPQGWAVIAEAMLGRGDRAYEYLRAYMPSAYNERAEVRGVEPYVHCQSTHGRHSPRFGASRLPWLTGAASWSYFSATQWVLGIRPEWDGLYIDPAIPAEWDGFTVERRFRGALYRITVENPEHVEHGIVSLTADGQEIPPHQCLPVAKPGSEVEVRAVLGDVGSPYSQRRLSVLAPAR
jgi:cellobiose phosphorylase